MLINTSAIACSKLGIVETRNCCGLLYRIMTLSSVGLLCFLMVWPQTDYFKVGPEAHHVPEAESWLQFSGSDHPLNSLSTQWSIHHITSHLIWRPLCCMDFFFIFKFSDIRFKGVVECANLFHLLTWEWNRIVQLEGAFKGHLFQLHSHFGANQKSKQNNEYVSLKPFLILKNSLRAFLIMEISEESQRI